MGLSTPAARLRWFFSSSPVRIPTVLACVTTAKRLHEANTRFHQKNEVKTTIRSSVGIIGYLTNDPDWASFS